MTTTRKPQKKQAEQKNALVKRKPTPRELENFKIWWKLDLPGELVQVK
jgi:hypothetical protein